MGNIYGNTTNKIDNIWNKVNEKSSILNKLTDKTSEPRTIYYDKKITEYMIDQHYNFLDNDNYLSFNILLGHFPIELLPFIKLMVIYCTTEAYQYSEILTSIDFYKLSAPERINKTYLYQAQSFIYQVDYDNQNEECYFIRGGIEAQLTMFDGLNHYRPLWGKVFLQVVNPGENDELSVRKQ